MVTKEAASGVRRETTVQAFDRGHICRYGPHQSLSALCCRHLLKALPT